MKRTNSKQPKSEAVLSLLKRAADQLTPKPLAAEKEDQKETPDEH